MRTVLSFLPPRRFGWALAALLWAAATTSCRAPDDGKLRLTVLDVGRATASFCKRPMVGRAH